MTSAVMASLPLSSGISDRPSLAVRHILAGDFEVVARDALGHRGGDDGRNFAATLGQLVQLGLVRLDCADLDDGALVLLGLQVRLEIGQAFEVVVV